jgi:hypothetical protein
MGKKYQMTTKYTKWPKNIFNGRKIDQMDLKYAKIFHCTTLQNVPKLGFLVRKNHLATLLKTITQKIWAQSIIFSKNCSTGKGLHWRKFAQSGCPV